MRVLFVLGRAIFGGYFAWNGLNHFLQQESLSQYASAKGVAAAETAVPASGALLLAGGISVAAGIKPRQGLAAIIGFLVPVSLKMHRFWEVQDPNQKQAQTMFFYRNVMMLAAALIMFGFFAGVGHALRFAITGPLYCCIFMAQRSTAWRLNPLWAFATSSPDNRLPTKSNTLASTSVSLARACFIAQLRSRRSSLPGVLSVSRYVRYTGKQATISRSARCSTL